MCKNCHLERWYETRGHCKAINVSQSVVSKLLKEHRESGSITKRKRSTLILECKELLLKHYGYDDHLIQLKVVTGTLNA